MDEQRKHGWPFWFAVSAIALPVLYVLSIGPACWIGTRAGRAQWLFNEDLLCAVYHPIFAICDRGPQIGRVALHKYMSAGSPHAVMWEATARKDGYRLWIRGRGDRSLPSL